MLARSRAIDYLRSRVRRSQEREQPLEASAGKTSPLRCSGAPKAISTRPGLGRRMCLWSTLSKPRNRIGTTGTPSRAAINPMPGWKGLISPASVR